MGVGTNRDPGKREPPSPWWPPVADAAGQRWIPNLSDWRAGDIVLFSSHGDKDAVGRYIETQQKALTRLPKRHTRWIHAAVYLRDGVCVEATLRSGVSVRLDELGQRIGRSDVRVMRLRHTAEGDKWTPDAGWRIAEAALSYLSLRYPSFVSLRAAMQSDLIGHSAAMAAVREGARQTIYCSLLCHAAIVNGAGVDLAATMNMHPLPCAFSASKLFDEVPVVWCKPAE